MNDNELLNEAYSQVLEEGLGDRIKARGAQALGTAKGFGSRLRGAAQQTAAKGLNAVQGGLDKVADVAGYDRYGKSGLEKRADKLQQSGNKLQTQGARMGNEAKYQSYINNSTKTIVNDLRKLGMDVSDAVALEADLQDVILSHLKGVTPTGNLRDAKGRIGGSIKPQRPAPIAQFPTEDEPTLGVA